MPTYPGEFSMLNLLLGGALLELLLGALILRSAVAWRNRISSGNLVVPNFGLAIGVMGLSLLVAVALMFGFAAIVWAMVGLAMHSTDAFVRGWFLSFLMFAPLLCVCLYLARAWVLASMLHTDWEEGILIQMLELVYYFGAAIGLGLLAIVIVIAGR